LSENFVKLSNSQGTMHKEKNVKKHTAKLLLWIFLFSIPMLAFSHSGEGTITILHTNDMHSQFTPIEASWVDETPRPLVGGVVALDYFIQRERAKFPYTLLLDAGDITTGTLLSKMEVDSVRNGGFVEMMNIMGYDASTIGNHEFDEGQENLRKMLDMAQFDVVSANLYINDSLVAPQPYKIYKVGDVRVGVIGLILSDLSGVVAQKQLENVRVDDPAEVAQKYINKIDPKTDLIVLLTHQGDDQDVQMARHIKNADIIVGGHSHTRLTEALKENHILIVQAGSKTRDLGRLTIDVKGDSVAGYDYELMTTWVDSVKKPNAQLEQLVQHYEDLIEKDYAQVIGQLAQDWHEDEHRETKVGDYLTDVMRAVTQADFAVFNSGGIRKDISAGPITKKDIHELLPFENYLVTFQCSGAQLLQMIEKNARNEVGGSMSILQLSNIRYQYRVGADGRPAILSAQIDGKPIDPEAQYTGATVDFVLSGQALKYLGFEPDGHQKTGLLMADAVVDYIIKNPEVNSDGGARFVRVE
jgi:5'-nucleotidase/UDP-sugar diphosphatase